MPISVSQLRSVRISTRQHGHFQLRRLMVADIEPVERLELDYPQADEYVIRLLANQLLAPQLTLEQLHELPMSVLIHIARVWVRKCSITTREQNAATNTSAGIKSAVLTYVANWQSRQLEQVEPLVGSLASSIAGPGLLNIAEMVGAYERNAHNILSGLLIPKPELLAPNRLIIDAMKLVRIEPIVFEPIVSDSIRQSIVSLTSVLRSQLNFAPVLRALTQSIHEQMASIGPSVQHMLGAMQQQIASGISANNRWARWLAEVDAAEAVFADAGYGFADFLPIPFVVRSARRDPRTRHALITLQLAAYLRSPQFEQELHSLFASSKRLGRRWKSVSGGLLAHQQRDYQKSVLTWMREVEGLFKDLLVVMGSAKRTGESYVALENGLELRTKAGKPRFLTGIDMAVNHAGFDPASRLYPLAQTLNNDVRSDRNPISHGARYDYESAKLSVQGLLMIRMLAEEIVRIETLTKGA